MPCSGAPRNFWNIAPDLAVEIVSPSETADEVRDKVRDYLVAGTPLVWVVYPRNKEVVAHTPDGLARTVSGDAVLEDAAVLPGFSCPVANLFG
jgi:Uma2 family endonuclease